MRVIEKTLNTFCCFCFVTGHNEIYQIYLVNHKLTNTFYNLQSIMYILSF